MLPLHSSVPAMLIMPERMPACTADSSGVTLHGSLATGENALPQIKGMVRKGGLEPPRFYPPDPKSGASANSATFAIENSLLRLGGNGEGTTCQRRDRKTVQMRCRTREIPVNATLALAGLRRIPRRKVAPTRQEMRRLLNFVQLLINQHCDQHQQKYSGTDAEHPDGKDKPIDFGQQFGLLFLHVRIVVIEKELIVLVHGESAFVNQQDDQTNGKNPKHYRHDSQRHKPPQQVQSKCRGFPANERVAEKPTSTWEALTETIIAPLASAGPNKCLCSEAVTDMGKCDFPWGASIKMGSSFHRVNVPAETASAIIEQL